VFQSASEARQRKKFETITAQDEYVVTRTTDHQTWHANFIHGGHNNIHWMEGLTEIVREFLVKTKKFRGHSVVA
jgi:hypothetical protein